MKPSLRRMFPEITIDLWSGPQGEHFLVAAHLYRDHYSIMHGTHMDSRLPCLKDYYDGNVEELLGWDIEPIENPFTLTALTFLILKNDWPHKLAEELTTSKGSIPTTTD